MRSRGVLAPPAAPQVPAPAQGTHLELQDGDLSISQHHPQTQGSPRLQSKDKTALNKRWAELCEAAFISLLEITLTTPPEIHICFNGLNHTRFTCHSPVKQ